MKNLFEKYGSINYARATAGKLIGEGKKISNELKPELREVLDYFADYLIKRKR